MSASTAAATTTLSWFARHEARLAWRDWTMLMSGGRKLKDRAVLVGMAVFALGLHGIAYVILETYLPAAAIDAQLLAGVSISLVLSFTMMFSQALEQVTRAFYSRDDLDLILSSPAPAEHLFSVRIGAMVVTTALMSGLIVTPFVNVAAVLDGPHWLSAYLVVVALAAVAAGVAVLATLVMFRRIGPKRTRLVAQVTAAVVGASFLIGIQVVAILSYGSMSRFALISSQEALRMLPSADSVFWLPARAAMGAPLPLLAIIALAVAFFAMVLRRGAREFREHVVAAMGVSEARHVEAAADSARRFRPRSTLQTLIVKEWTLLRRDPWLVSQTLMQILYLIPPALMLWVSFENKPNIDAIIAPVLVMAAGQLAGALAWLAISGEDAPDLIATAPVRPLSLIWAKVLSVLLLIAIVTLPFVIAIAFISTRGALAMSAGVLAGAVCAILIQVWFRATARRTSFRRRQVASRVATVLEAFASILIAATAGMAAAGIWLAVAPAVLAVIVMLIAWLLSPRAA